MKVVYLRGALRDLEAIRAYIAQDDPDAARRVVARIERSIGRLATLPLSGRTGPRGIRLLAVPDLPYLVVHRVGDDSVKIVAVFHTARDRRE
ncbi:MAG: type II toxin-antitoxin system RelE/ParE family toxin [Rhizobiales bacterium]|jgi:toxin ParE1/3/4|nr:type II toxin-antitoxin system RelE/ParE family toxin [Hyphomicrobiales bacterium]